MNNKDIYARAFAELGSDKFYNTSFLELAEKYGEQYFPKEFAALAESHPDSEFNIAFDEKIIGAEFLRNNFQNILEVKKKICTMTSTVDFCKIPGQYGFKWPGLAELHIKLFGENFDNAHDAFADIEATANCFWELKKKEVL